MALEREASVCAYCGEPGADTADHVIPGCLYPKRRSEVQRLTVPAHRACNQGFSLDETAFKEAVAGTGWNDAARSVQQSVLRGFGRRETHGRAADFLRRTRWKDSPAGPQLWIYPHTDPRVVRVLKKITRGLAYHHRFFVGLSDERVEAHWAPLPPPELLAEMEHHHREADVCEYWFRAMRPGEEPTFMHSFWLLRFYERCTLASWILR
jgi:hypothetical protein